MKLKARAGLLLVACAVVLAPNYASAAACTGMVTVPATCAGALDAESGTPGSVVVESLTLTAPSAVTIYTTSYGGGTNLDGSTTTSGGFQPNITLFDTTGFAVAFENGSTSPIANPDPANGWRGDGYVSDASVAAGTYYVILTDVNNQVSAAFTGFGSTTPDQFYRFFSGPGGTSFTDSQGFARNGEYSLNINASSSAATPEPGTLWLVLPVLGVVALIARRRRASLRPMIRDHIAL